MATIGHQTGIGELARRTGLSKAHISKIFNGLRRPSWRTAKLIADRLSITLDELYEHLDSQRKNGRAA